MFSDKRKLNHKLHVSKRKVLSVNMITNGYPLEAKKKHQHDIECAEQVMIKASLLWVADSVWVT